MFKDEWKDPVKGKIYQRDFKDGKYKDESGKVPKLKKKQSEFEEGVIVSSMSEDEFKEYCLKFQRFNVPMEAVLIYEKCNSFWYRISKGKLRRWIESKLWVKTRKKYDRTIKLIAKSSTFR